MTRAPAPRAHHDSMPGGWRQAAVAYALALGAAVAPAVALPSPVRVDDLGTVVARPITPLQWRQPVPGRQTDATLQGAVEVRVRLNMTPWLGKPVRLYLALAPLPGRRVQASWTGAGVLLPGTLASGQRALVFTGVLRSPVLADTLALQLLADGRTLDGPSPLAFHFEAEDA